MKKLFVLAITVCLLLTATLGGCSCNPEVALSFTNAFYGDGNVSNVSNNYTEELIYDVTYINNHKDYPTIVKDNSINSAITVNEETYTNGSYTSTLKLSPNGYPTDLPASTVALKLNSNDGVPMPVFVLETVFKITVDYKTDGQSQPYNDFIKNTVYFCLSENSFAPIYVKTESEETRVSIANNKANLTRTRSEYTTVYQTSKHKITTEITSLEDGSVLYKKTKTYAGTAKTSIDNAQLFFILRNKTTKVDGTVNLPVVSPAYGDKKELIFKHKKNSQFPVTVTYNGIEVSDTLPVRNLTYAINSNKTSGATQYLVYQTGKSTNNLIDRNTSLLVEYVEPLIAYGTMSCLGGLKFTIKSINQTF